MIGCSEGEFSAHEKYYTSSHTSIPGNTKIPDSLKW